MNNGIRSFLIGIALSGSFWLLSISTSDWFFGATIISIIMAIATVFIISESPGVYAAYSVLFGTPINVLAFGIENGLIISLSLMFIYAYFLVLIFEMLFISSGAIKVFMEFISKRITNR